MDKKEKKIRTKARKKSWNTGPSVSSNNETRSSNDFLRKLHWGLGQAVQRM